MTKQQKLYLLLQDNNLQLSLADLIEFTYHQWCDQYLTVGLAAEHIASNTKSDLATLALTDKLATVINLGRDIATANFRN